ncbi:hypothetical protein SBV1_2450014 [Verrucomicrobia bacterium]|nr:hypothetical protein SBV1_2450014 [Verrucomicrobiota bacterium]
MKTLTTREFYHSPGVLKALRPGQSVLVTDKGKPALIVTKAGRRPIKTAADLRREAKELFPDPRPPVNFTAIMRKMKE